MSYQGGTTNREQVDEEAAVFTANDDPPDVTIEPHNEMAYATVYPPKIMFFCLKAPGEGCGGETAIIRNRTLQSKLDKEVLQKFEEKQIRYIRYLPHQDRKSYMPWQRVLMTENTMAVEQFLERQGYNYSWDESGGILYWYKLSAFKNHPISDERIWHNQAHVHHCSKYRDQEPMRMVIGLKAGETMPDHQFLTHTAYGDGTPIEPAVLQHIRAKTWESAVGFRWKDGDVLVCENVLAQHSRISYTGERRMLTYITKD